MDTEIRELLEDIWAYCEENMVAVLAAAAVAVILLLSIVLICAAKREDRKALQEQAAAESGGEEILPVQTAEAEAQAAAEEEMEAAEEAEAEEKAETEKETEAETEDPVDTPASEVLQEAAAGMVDSLVKSMESAAGASGQKVESIELKIEKAQLTIRYAGDDEKTVTEKLSAETSEPDCAYDAAEDMAAAEPEDVHTDFAEKTGRAKRFGLDNMNTARSGRVYTEEELLNQIRD